MPTSKTLTTLNTKTKMMPKLLEYALGHRIYAFSTMRTDGASQGAYAQFNINPYCGDAPEHVVQNLHSLCRVLGIAPSNLVMPHQTHETTVRQVGSELLSMPQNVRQMVLESVDALITNVPGVCIGVSTADCIPILLYDTEHRGTVKRIAQNAIIQMRAAFDTNPKSLRAVIAPGISLQHFEVGDEVYEAFAKAAFPMNDIAQRHNKWHINLPLCNQLQLQELGVKAENIYATDICTYNRCNDFFSARRLGINSGRIFTGVTIR